MGGRTDDSHANSAHKDGIRQSTAVHMDLRFVLLFSALTNVPRPLYFASPALSEVEMLTLHSRCWNRGWKSRWVDVLGWAQVQAGSPKNVPWTIIVRRDRWQEHQDLYVSLVAPSACQGWRLREVITELGTIIAVGTTGPERIRRMSVTAVSAFAGCSFCACLCPNPLQGRRSHEVRANALRRDLVLTTPAILPCPDKVHSRSWMLRLQRISFRRTRFNSNAEERAMTSKYFEDLWTRGPRWHYYLKIPSIITVPVRVRTHGVREQTSLVVGQPSRSLWNWPLHPRPR